MKKGVIVRHMIMPGHTKDAKNILKYLYDTYGDNIYISIMNQYTPPKDFDLFPEINRRVTKREYERVVDYAINLGISNAFIQEGDTAKESFIPDFDDDVFLNEIV
jgi:putative pyruvate formate lyase activating enzyme